MGHAIFQKAAKRGDFFQKQIVFRSASARLIAGRSKRVRYDIDSGDMLAYGLHSSSFPGRSLIDAATTVCGTTIFCHIDHGGISIQIKRRRDVQGTLNGQA
jgi:hypothetical protein